MTSLEPQNMTSPTHSVCIYEPRGLYCSCVHTGTHVAHDPALVHAWPQKLFIVLRYAHTEKDHVSGYSYAIMETKTAPNSKTLPHIEFPMFNAHNDPTTIFISHFKQFFDTKNMNHPDKRIFGKNVHYTKMINFSDESEHCVLRISLHNIPDEKLAQSMLESLGQHGKIVKWMPSEQMRSIFSPSFWQRRITGLKFSTQPESKRIWDTLSLSSDHFQPNFWLNLNEISG